MLGDGHSAVPERSTASAQAAQQSSPGVMLSPAVFKLRMSLLARSIVSRNLILSCGLYGVVKDPLSA